MQYKYVLNIFIFVLSMAFFVMPVDIHALEIDNSSNYSLKNTLLIGDACDPEVNTSVFGNVKCEESVAWLLQKILNYIRVLGPSLAIILTIIDFTTAIVSSSDDNMKKVKSKFINRLIAVALLFFIPTITMIVLNLVGLTNSTAGIS